jgi:aminopeptidase N
MLRNLLLDPGSSDETRFRALLHDFYRSHAGGSATTADFRAAAEKAAGEDLGWFFRQWVEGVDVPTYKYQWSAEPDGSGWKIKGRIDQSNVPDSFRMPMFVRLELPDRRFSRQRVWVTGPVTEFEFGGLPEKPSNVVFNELQSVLCEVAK